MTAVSGSSQAVAQGTASLRLTPVTTSTSYAVRFVATGGAVVVRFARPVIAAGGVWVVSVRSWLPREGVPLGTAAPSAVVNTDVVKAWSAASSARDRCRR